MSKQSLPELLAYAQRLTEEIAFRKRLNPLDWHVSLPMQQKFEDDPSRKKALFGANRAGKSECAAKYVLNRCLAKPRQKWWCVNETFQDSVTIQQNKVWNLVPKNEIAYGKYDEINGFTNRKLKLKNGSLITFLSYDQGVTAFQGADVDGIVDDEEPPYEIYREQCMRLIDRNGEMVIAMTSINGITDLIASIFEDYEAIETQYAPLVEKELPRIAVKGDFKFYFLWSSENPYVDQQRLADEAKLLTYDEKLCRLYGYPVNLTGKIYPSMSREAHVITWEELPEGQYTLYNILDPHDAKPWFIIWVAVHKTGSAYVVDEYPDRDFWELQYNDKTYADYATVIRLKERNLKEQFGVDVHKRIIDPNFGNKTVQLANRQGGQSTTTPKRQLEALGLQYKDGIDALEAGHLAVRELLHYERADNGEVIVAPRLQFVENCANTITCMLRYNRKDMTAADGDIKDKVKPMEKYKHGADVVRYGVMAGLRYVEKDTRVKEFQKVY